jgi:hypothetical protein
MHTGEQTGERNLTSKILGRDSAGLGGFLLMSAQPSFDAQAVKKQLGIAISQWDSFM